MRRLENFCGAQPLRGNSRSLMCLRLFISGHEPQLMSKDASIRTELLFLLFEILKDFLVQVISQVIILEEEHRRFRGRTKVWRKNLDEVSWKV